jgi:hypothetical protein
LGELGPQYVGLNDLVTQVAGPLAQARLWQMLLDPDIFGP